MTLTIIQARLGSRRLPGKVLERIGDRTILEHVIRRVRAAALGEVVVATTSRVEDLAIMGMAATLGVHTYAGPEDDVLTRFVEAQRVYGIDADVVVRVTADCPFLDPDLLRQVAMLAGTGDVDYAGVTGAPDGLHQEAFTVNALLRAHAYATDPADREHVVPYMTRNFRCGFVEAKIDGDACMVDTPADLERLRKLAA